MPVTHSSTAKQEEKQEERGSCQPLRAIGNRLLTMLSLKYLLQNPLVLVGFCIHL